MNALPADLLLAAQRFVEDWGDDGPYYPLVSITVARQLHEMVQVILAEAVENARAQECTWKEIALALGVSHQAAWEKYGKANDKRACRRVVDSGDDEGVRVE